MKIYYKESWAFWIFKRYSFYVEDEFEGVTEFIVESMASPFCKSNNITIKLSSIVDDTFIEKYSSTSPTISSWDEFDWSTSSDWASFNPCDNIPPYPDIIGSWDDNITNKEDMKTYTEQNIEKTFGKIVSKISVLHHCWEVDGYGYIVEKEGKKILVLTNHGNPYIATVSDLYSKISEYNLEKGIEQYK